MKGVALRAAALAGALALPGTAFAYTVTRGAEPVGETPSRFEPREFPASRFEPRPQASAAADAPAASTFGLRIRDSQVRQRAEATLTAFGARREGGRIIVSLPSDVLFDFDKYAIRADARPVLARLSQVLVALLTEPVAIIGHTDSRGSDAYNQTLSERRAVSVRAWLAGLGVRLARMSTAGRGETSPVAPNEAPDGSDDPAGRQKNRRVVFVIGSGD